MRAPPKCSMNANVLLVPVLLLLLVITYMQYSSFSTIVNTTPAATPLPPIQATTKPPAIKRRSRKRRPVIVTPTPLPNSNFSFRLEDEDHCSGWTFRSWLFPSDNQRLEMRTNGSLFYGNWDGYIPLDVFFPLKQQCVRGTPATPEQASAFVNPHNTLCTYDQTVKTTAEQKNRTTIVFEMINDARAYEHMVRDFEHLGLNLWHFHVDYFPLWLAIRRVEVTAHLLLKNETFLNMTGVVFPDKLKPVVDLVFVFPDGELRRFQDPAMTTPVVYNGSNALQLHKKGGKFSALAGVQGIHDGLDPQSKVILTQYSTSVKDLQSVLREQQLNPRPVAWLKPTTPTLLLWTLERQDLEGQLDQCKDSILDQYSKHLLNSVPIRHKTRHASHICFVSRQLRAMAGSDQPILSRNLMADVFLEVIKRLSAPIVLSPHIFVRDGGADPVPSQLQQSSVTGQMRFVYQECGVLVGVHGAGLSNLFGLRPGAHLIEFVSGFNYTIFKNSALLLNNVSYSRIVFDAELLSKVHHHEVNFTLPNEKLVQAIDVINEALRDSIIRQETLNNELTVDEAKKSLRRNAKVRRIDVDTEDDVEFGDDDDGDDEDGVDEI